MKISKARFLPVAMAFMMLVTLLAGAAFASDAGIMSTQVTNHSFTFSLPKGGVTQVGASARKETYTNLSARYSVSSISNSSGLSCYLNVRSADGTNIVGNATSVTGTGIHYVSYLGSHGIFGTYYCPSAQTDNDSTVSASMGGTWYP